MLQTKFSDSLFSKHVFIYVLIESRNHGSRFWKPTIIVCAAINRPLFQCCWWEQKPISITCMLITGTCSNSNTWNQRYYVRLNRALNVRKTFVNQRDWQTFPFNSESAIIKYYTDSFSSSKCKVQLLRELESIQFDIWYSHFTREQKLNC